MTCSVFGAWAGLTLATLASARVIEPAMRTPAATVGGVLAIPLQGSPDDTWPERMTIERVDGGASFEGSLAWISSAPPALERAWISADERLEVRSVARAPQGAPPDSSGVVVLLAEAPADLRGPVRVSGVTVEPEWHPLAEPRPDPGRPQLAAGDTPTLDRPDPAAPAEWFRWWLLADEVSCRPPEPAGDAEAALYALHRAQLWQAGLDRVERVSPGVAREIREQLTATCVDRRGDRSVRVAAWIARGDELAAMLSILLDATRTDEQVMEAMLTRLRERAPITCWIEADAGNAMRLAIANPSPQPVALRATWAESRFTPAVEIEVPAGQIARRTVDRPAELMPDPLTRNAAPGAGTLVLAGSGWDMRVPVPPARVVPRPPAHAFGVLRPPLSLADAQRMRIAPPPPEWGTVASLRRRFGRWEIFAECLRPSATDLDELELVVAGDGVPAMRVRMREAGDPVVEGPANLVLPRIERGSFGDRWRCTIELPESWVSPKGAMMLGIARAPGGAGTRQTGALAVPDWMPVPVLLLDPAGWWSGTPASSPRPDAARIVEPLDAPASTSPDGGGPDGDKAAAVEGAPAPAR